MGKETIFQGQSPRQVEASADRTGSGPVSKADSGPGQDLQLELERLRAERDAMAAELQIERAERLHIEERLRLLEREKLEQMRQGAASREKLASELEEARLRAMRAEARQQALEADTRLHEIESRRRAPWSQGSDIGPLANEVAEAPDDEADGADGAGEADEAPGEEPASVEQGHGASRQARLARPGGGSHGRAGAGAPVTEPGAVAGRSRGAGGAGASPSARRSQAGSDADELPTSRLRGPATERRAPPDAAGTPGRGGTTRPGGASRSGSGGARRGGEGDGATKGATGGAAAGRPSLDRARLEAKLEAGAVIQTTERFGRFEPVSQSHIKVCDWLKEAKTLAAVQKLAAGEMADREILSVLVFFLERSFLVLDD